MKFKTKDKEKWNRIFTLFPVKTIEGLTVWMESVYVRYRFMGYDYFGYGSEFIIEYSIKGES